MTHACRLPRLPANTRPSRPTAAPARLRSLVARAALLLAACGGLAALPGCAGPGNKGEEGQMAQAIPASSFARAWATNLELKNDQVDRLYVRNDMLFVYTKNGTSYVMSRDSGAIRHSDEVAGGNYRLHAPVVLKDFIVYPTTSSLEVYGLTGGLDRSLDLGASVHTDAIGNQNTIFVVLDMPNGTVLRRLDLTDKYPVRKWDLQPFHGSIAGAPAFNTDVVYVADQAGLVYAVTADGRQSIWTMDNPPYNNTFDAMSAVVADLKADDAGVYVPTLGPVHKLYCLNRTNGRVKWQYTATAGLETSPVVTSDTVYQYDPGRGVVAINKLEDPELHTPQFQRQMEHGARWERKDVKQILAQDDKLTYALRNDGTILALDKKTGETQFTSRRKDFAAFATNTKDGTIYAATKEGRVVAVKAVLQAGQVGELVLNEVPAGEAVAMAAPSSVSGR